MPKATLMHTDNISSNIWYKKITAEIFMKARDLQIVNLFAGYSFAEIQFEL